MRFTSSFHILLLFSIIYHLSYRSLRPMFTMLQIPFNRAPYFARVFGRDVVAAGGSLISRVRRDASSSRRESHGVTSAGGGGGAKGVDGGRRRPVSGMVRRWETSREVPQDWWTSSPTYSHAWLFVGPRAYVRACVTRARVPCVVITGR